MAPFAPLGARLGALLWTLPVASLSVAQGGRGLSCSHLATHASVLSFLGVRQDNLVSGGEARFLRVRQDNLSHSDPDQLSALPVTKCPQNTFFVDWGSTGMKVYPVHTSGTGARVLSLKKVKIPGLSPVTPTTTLTRVLDGMDAKLHNGHRGGAIMGTAGFRLQPAAAEATWAGIRQWNDKHSLLEKCDAKEQDGCRTLKGTEEAYYELNGMVNEARRGHADLGRSFGFVSCGGASIQLGIWGGPKELMSQCVNDLEHLGRRPDSQRSDWATISDDGRDSEVLFSWLADHVERPGLAVGGMSDNHVGGINEMLARFDGWLEQRGITGNPCVHPAADAHHALGPVCDELHGKGKPCLVDPHGGYITRLPGKMDSTQDSCRESANAFLATDEMLVKWSGSSACRGLAAGTPLWGFLSAFHRPQQLGVELSSDARWRDIHACAAAGRSTRNVSAPAKEHFGTVLTSTLLTGFLREIGLNDNARVRAFEAEVAEEAMRERDLARGWLAEC